MTLPAGTRLGPYEILLPLGAGGMGEVYKARDTRLGREVAVKVLPAHLSENLEFKQRFEREAKAISQLSHPHICALYDVGSWDGVEYLVMELLEGQTLAKRLVKGALPTEQVLRLGIEIADALDSAHRHGIVHRDLKPGNVMLTKSGVKLLDFGLAKTVAPEKLPSDRSSLPTEVARSQPLTEKGTVMGTFQYMAPEQLEGKEADSRTDIFALGCVLYEMATGEKAFTGMSQASLVTAIMSEDPEPISSAQPMTPPAFDRIVKTCLAKDPEDRWQSARDAMRELKWIAEGGSQVWAPAIVGWRRRSREHIAWILSGLLALAAGALSLRLFSRTTVAAAVTRATILPPEGAELVSTWVDAGPVEISPDGSHLVFTARQGEGPNQLWVRTLSESSARVLAGTEGARRPFWSPDGRFIGFFTDTSLKKIDVNGGPVFSLAQTTDSRGGTWNRDGAILFSPDSRGPVYRISAAGGKARPATVYGPNDASHRYPHFLPDGKHFLYLLRHIGVVAGSEPAVMVGALDSKESKLVVNVASNAVYASGYLLYVREGALVAQRFDLNALSVSGDPVTISPDVRMDERFSRGIFSASENGVLVYQTGKISRLSALRWFDRGGKVLATIGEPAQFFNGGDPEISPDGTRATAAIVDLRTGISDIWMIDLAHGIRSRFTTGTGDKFAAAWSRDGGRIAFNITHSGGSGYDIVVKPASGSGSEERLVSDSVEYEFPCGFSPDGRFFLYQGRRAGRDDVWALPLFGERKLIAVATTSALEQLGQLSPDGRYVAYMSDESGRFEIYVATFPGSGGRWQVSQNGGIEPRWRGDGKEIFFFAPDNRLMAAQVRAEGESFEAGVIQPLFQARTMGGSFRYDVAKDGSRFLVTSGLPENFSPITLVTNWTAELKK